MKIVKVHGGLGNQMFQYAFAKALSVASGDGVSIDVSAFGLDPAHNGFELGRLFALTLPLADDAQVRRLSTKPRGPVSRIRRKYFTKRTHFIDRKFSYQGDLLKLAGDRYYEGYFQSEKYFGPIAGSIRKEYTFQPGLDERSLEALESLERPIASVHVRRGDYLSHPNLDICTPAYFRRALERARQAGAASYMVFSDDIPYCRGMLELDESKAAWVDWNRGEESWRDMDLMSRCDVHVIANSSFSWWGAWLDAKPGSRVIAPAVWNRREIRDTDHYYTFTFGDIVPEGWERVAI